MIANLAERFARTRTFSERLCAPLATEDYVVQAMPDASPTSWHLAHTTWFFETFVLSRWERGYRPINADYQVLFNSYYNSVGEQFPRPRRGMLTRPTVAEVFGYRREVDERMSRLMQSLVGGEVHEAASVIELGIQHEQQHQELILTDVKYLFSCNPLRPVYREAKAGKQAACAKPDAWIAHDGGVVEIGYGGDGFCFDNERPRHRVYLEPFELNHRLVTNGEYLNFVKDRGYRRPELWLSLGWTTAREQQWSAPLYWIEQGEQWLQFTLDDVRPLDADEPVCHVSYFEADAFARWSGARLPTEFEWERAAEGVDIADRFAEGERLHPSACRHDCAEIAQLYGETWQWTSSPYTAYPGFETAGGALGEYNGKFMCNQYVLRGGSCATPPGHVRETYRNFFPPEARWQFTGIRLARDTKR
ncbi:MAG: ergothioneine biosynthesis protein EgtB [Pirellulales bacterium]